MPTNIREVAVIDGGTRACTMGQFDITPRRRKEAEVFFYGTPGLLDRILFFNVTQTAT